MTNEQRKQLVEMAIDSPYSEVGFMAGAQAAWDMATKAERDRCAKIARDCHGCSGSQTAKEILNPTPASKENE